MVKINFIVLFFIFLSPIVCAQRVVVSDSVVFSGVVFDTQDSQTLPNVTCRYGEGKATISDQMGCFVLKIGSIKIPSALLLSAINLVLLSCPILCSKIGT